VEAKVQHRISAGGVVIDKGRMLLVRYSKSSGESYLVCPGGGVDDEESITDAVRREVLEETGVQVCVSKLLMVEDIIAARYRMMKSWFLCQVTGGALSQMQGAVEEGIIEARWYSRDEVECETVFPSIVRLFDWSEFCNDAWKPVFKESRIASF
jgi:ADP-ribose pyrophosphatase YjhB (NUDIX family)